MTRTTAHYHSTILERLKARDRDSDQFSRVFNSHAALCESFDNLAKCGNSRSSPTTENVSQRLEAANNELDELYKRKAINDQTLIEAKQKFTEVEARLAILIEERNDARNRLDLLYQQIATSKEKCDKLAHENNSLKAIFDSTQEEYQRVNDEYVDVDLERVTLIDEIKRIKEQQIAKMNEQNEIIEKKRLEKITSGLADAVRINQPVTQKISQLASEMRSRGASTSTTVVCGGGDTSDDSIEHIGDVIPMRCRTKLEVDDLGEVSDCLFHLNGRLFFTGGSDKTVRMFEFSDDGIISKKGTLTGANQGVTRLSLDAEYGFLAASSVDKTVRIWSISDRRLRVTFTGHTDKVVAARFVNNSRMIVSGSADRNVKLFDIASNRCIHTYFPGSIVHDVAVNDRYSAPIITSHYDKSVRFYDLRATAPANIMKFGGKITSLFADGHQLLCSCRDETLSLIDLRNNGIVHCYSAESYRTASDYSKCVMSPGGTYIAAGSADGHLYVWNTMSTKLEKVLYKNAHENTPILSLAWHPRGHAILSGDKRKTLCLWT